MAESHFPTTNYVSTHYVESAGGIVFSRSSLTRRDRRVCILYHIARREYLLAKGRRNHGETVQQCALREVGEEAGLKTLALLPICLPSRATPVEEPSKPGTSASPDTPDEVRMFRQSTDPFTCSLRQLGNLRGEGEEIKLIWWFVMQANEAEEGEGKTGEEGWERRWMDVAEALRTLTFEKDREIVRTAVTLVPNVNQRVAGREKLGVEEKDPKAGL